MSTSGIADCTRAYELTRSENSAQLPLCIAKEYIDSLGPWLKKRNKKPHKNTKDKCGKCIDIQAMNKNKETERLYEKDQDWSYYENPDLSTRLTGAHPRHELPHPQAGPSQQPLVEDKSQKPLGWIGHIFQVFTGFGLFSVSWDTWKSSIWDLFTHAGFFTYVHHDGAGFCTYAFVRTGCKIWGIHRPNITANEINRNSIFDVLRKILKPHGRTDYKDYTDLYNVFLMKGDVL
jgi:hypothetical protein